MIAVIGHLSMRESQDGETGSEQGLISAPIFRLLRGCAVISEPVRLHHQSQFRPEEVHPESAHA
ncbi:MAG TPA: hypothetical protein VFN72_07325, partial [Solirubrobacterales bacterium]|nr:hypothetical protein [Solirubrobacterales bacterium]